MKNKLLRNTLIIQVLSGIILLAYVFYSIYSRSQTGIPLKLLPFTIVCEVIVVIGFGLAAVHEYLAGKKGNLQNSRAVKRCLIEGVIIAVFIKSVA